MQLQLILFAAFASAVAMRASAAECTEPGKARWVIKSSVPALSLKHKPKRVALNDLVGLVDAVGVTHNDKRFATKRITSEASSAGLKEGDLITTNGWLHLVALEDNDCEYHIQLSNSATDGNHCLIVEVAKDDAT
jgi:hypothetical protein